MSRYGEAAGPRPRARGPAASPYRPALGPEIPRGPLPGLDPKAMPARFLLLDGRRAHAGILVRPFPSPVVVRMRVLIQLRPSPDVVAAVADPGVTDDHGRRRRRPARRRARPAPSPRSPCPGRCPPRRGRPAVAAPAADVLLRRRRATVLVRGEISDDERHHPDRPCCPRRRPRGGGRVRRPGDRADASPAAVTRRSGDWRDVERLLARRRACSPRDGRVRGARWRCWTPASTPHTSPSSSAGT